MLSRVASKPRLCCACLQTLRQRPRTLTCTTLPRASLLRRPYSSGNGNAIRGALEALANSAKAAEEERALKKKSDEKEITDEKPAEEDDAFARLFRVKKQTEQPKAKKKGKRHKNQKDKDDDFSRLFREKRRTGFEQIKPGHGALEQDPFGAPKSLQEEQNQSWSEIPRDSEPGAPQTSQDEADSAPSTDVAAADDSVAPKNDAELKDDAEPKDDGESKDDTVPKNPFEHELIHHKKLDIDALGQSVEALVIKNPNRVKLPRRAPRAIEEKVIEHNLQWDGLIPQKDSESDFSDIVWKNLEELRPTRSIVPLEEFTQIMNTLVEGFKKDQLIHYYNVESISEPAPEHQRDYPWMIKQGIWVAEKPHEWGRLSPKQAHALAIMVRRWGLEIREHVESPGRIQIWFQPSVFRLLTRLQNNILERLSSEVLDRSIGEKITANPTEARLSIYTRKTAVPIFLDQLAESLQSLKSRRVSVANINPDRLEHTVLKELARLTNTHIEHDPSTKELEITWINEEQADRTVSGGLVPNEDSADVVSRLLLAVEPKQTLSTTAEVLAPLKRVSTALNSFTKYEREKRSMSWRDKLGSWSRYAYHIGLPTTGKRKGLALPDRLSLPTPPFDPTEPGTQNRLTATFGHILHASEDASHVASSDSHRILSPVVPHPAAFTSITGGTESQVAQNTAIILNFSPADSSNSAGKAPEVRLRLPLDPDTDLSDFSFPPNSALYGLVPWNTHDVLLPSEAVDVRLSHQRMLALDTEQNHLKSFLASSVFNLLAGDLRTPSRTNFAIPANWLTAESTDAAERTVEVPYVFMGLEVHQSVDLEWEGHILRYNSVEAGRHGGQRQELSLQAKAGEQGVLTEEQFKDFARLVQDVATGKKFSWNDGYKLALERSQEEFEIELVDEDAENNEGGADVLEGGQDGDGTLLPATEGLEYKEAAEAEPSTSEITQEEAAITTTDVETTDEALNLEQKDRDPAGDTSRAAVASNSEEGMPLPDSTAHPTHNSETLPADAPTPESDSVPESTPSAREPLTNVADAAQELGEGLPEQVNKKPSEDK